MSELAEVAAEQEWLDPVSLTLREGFATCSRARRDEPSRTS